MNFNEIVHCVRCNRAIKRLYEAIPDYNDKDFWCNDCWRKLYDLYDQTYDNFKNELNKIVTG